MAIIRILEIPLLNSFGKLILNSLGKYVFMEVTTKDWRAHVNAHHVQRLMETRVYEPLLLLA